MANRAASITAGITRQFPSVPSPLAAEDGAASCPDCEGVEGCSGCDGTRLVYAPHLFEVLLDLRSGVTVDRRTAYSVAEAVGARPDLWEQASKHAMFALCSGAAVTLSEVLAIEDLFRRAIGRQVRRVAFVGFEGMLLRAALCEDMVVTIYELGPTGAEPLDRGRLSRTGYLVQVGGSPRLAPAVYAAFEKAFQRALS